MNQIWSFHGSLVTLPWIIYNAPPPQDQIEDEQYIFEGVEVSEKERKDLEYKKQVYELAMQRAKDLDEVTGYKMPEAYDDQDGKVRDLVLGNRPP